MVGGKRYKLCMHDMWGGSAIARAQKNAEGLVVLHRLNAYVHLALSAPSI